MTELTPWTRIFAGSVTIIDPDTSTRNRILTRNTASDGGVVHTSPRRASSLSTVVTGGGTLSNGSLEHPAFHSTAAARRHTLPHFREPTVPETPGRFMKPTSIRTRRLPCRPPQLAPQSDPACRRSKVHQRASFRTVCGRDGGSRVRRRRSRPPRPSRERCRLGPPSPNKRPRHSSGCSPPRWGLRRPSPRWPCPAGR